MRVTTMRVWLVEERSAEEPEGLDGLLRQLIERSGGQVVLQGTGPLTSESLDSLRAALPDLVVVDGPSLPDPEPLCALATGVVVATTPEGCVRLQTLAETHPVVFVPPRPTVQALWLALLGARAAQLRQAHSQAEVERLQQRLQDRIVIERAKGVLMQSLRISEEEAYNRLRVSSRQQRRHMREIAQWLLDHQPLLAESPAHSLEGTPVL